MAVAGHPPPLVDDNGSFRPLKVESQLVLGVESSAKYPTEVFRFEHDVLMLLYTDGLPDLMNDAGERLTIEGLARMLTGTQGAADLAQTVQSAVMSIRGESELADDLTFIAVRLSPSETAMRHASGRTGVTASS
jgi:serine phosphatase RsbU (regulator of sigma subunit)